MSDRIALFDMSGWYCINKLYRSDIQGNNEKFGLRRYDVGGHGISEFVVLRRKIYSVETIKLIPDGDLERFQ